jgi:hypothetical protein
MRCIYPHNSLASSTFLDSIIWQSCHHEKAASSIFIRDMTNLGAEFSNNNWDEDWTTRFDLSTYITDKNITNVPLPRLMVESMLTVSEFAEGVLDQPLQIEIGF